MDDFYAARDNTMPSLPWPSIAPPFTGIDQDLSGDRLFRPYGAVAQLYKLTPSVHGEIAIFVPQFVRPRDLFFRDFEMKNLRLERLEDPTDR